jgi:2'-5' RNA ligase
MKRLFIALPIELNKTAKEEIINLQHQLAMYKIKWVSLENTHLTLVFLGDTDEIHLSTICDAIDSLESEFHKYQIELAGLSIFGNKRSPRVLWTRWLDNDETKHLALSLQNKLTPLLSITEKNENFVPHLTLGRIKSLSNIDNFYDVLDKYSNFSFGKYIIDRIILFESKLTSLSAIWWLTIQPLHLPTWDIILSIKHWNLKICY